MSAKKIYRRCLLIILIAAVMFSSYYTWDFLKNEFPDVINISAFDEAEISTNVPVSVQITSDDAQKGAITASSSWSSSIIIKAGNSGDYSMSVSIAGIIPIKTVEVNVLDDNMVIPCGFPVGLYLQTDGVLVVDSGAVISGDGVECSPAANLVKSGDYITSINNIPVTSKSQLIYLIGKYGDDDITIGINRDGEELFIKITPVKDENGEYKLGIWVRDDSQGIGTLTYMTSDGTFGALGHGISDIDTGELLSSNDGVLYKTQIWGIKKGEDGNPGGMCGVINYDNENIIGIIEKNTSYGVFGQIDTSATEQYSLEPMEICYKQDVQIGKAYIRCTVDGSIKDYEIEILETDLSGSSMDKGIVIEITDPELLEMTNGIIQGMSGSPIIQNGKLVGAVTHVFVQNSKKGYGIFIENMIYANEYEE